MRKSRPSYTWPFPFKLLVFAAWFLFFFTSCNDDRHIDVTHQEMVESPEQINARAEEVIQGTLKDIFRNSRDLADSFKIKNPGVVQSLYDRNSYHLLWSAKGLFTRNGDSLFSLIRGSRHYGLFPDDYYFTRLNALKNQLINDTSEKKKLNASLWAFSDMLLTSAFVQLVKDLKIGRLLPDTTLAKDSTLTPDFFLGYLRGYQLISNDSFARQLEPKHTGYKKLKLALDSFLKQASFKDYTFIPTIDSTRIPPYLYKRLSEEDSTIKPNPIPDTLALAQAVRKYQRLKKLPVDGRVSASLINRLNDSDKERFMRIAINMDRYKLLQALPPQYIWVNLPSYYLLLKDSDTVVLKSRVVVGKPLTRTPVITSYITDMITYPKWTIPESIVKKEILPGLKKDPGYTLSRGYVLLDNDGNEVDPYTVLWANVKFIPFKVVQGSGDDNALGVLKFNFPNKYSVYLHDTNQRYFFSKKSRALSHGCVRVQAWDELAKYILRNDSTYSTNAIPVDSMLTWLAQKQKRYIPVRKPIPLFIRYFTCDASEGRLVFYEDIYGEDQKIRETIFANKQIL